MTTIEICPKFKELLPPLTSAEFEQLEQSILADGIREPLKIWRNKLVDGHNRYQLAQSYDLPYAVIDLHFTDEDEVCECIITNQLGRRNLEPNIKTLFIGQLYELQKKRQGAPEGNKNAAENNGATVAPLNEIPQPTAEKVAEQFDVSPRTVKTAAKVARAFEEADDETKDAFKKGEFSQKKLVDSAKKEQDKTATIDSTRFDSHTNNFKLHGGRIAQAAKALQQTIDEYENYIHAGKLNEACAQLNVCFFNNLYLFDELLNRPFRIYKNSS